jgi:hypothetical protein
MKRDRDWHRDRARRELTKALFLVDYDPEAAAVFAMLSVLRFADWLDLDAVERTIRGMTTTQSPEENP